VQFLIVFVCLCQWPYEAAALAFEAIPRTLAQNCGLNVIRIMTQLQGKVIIPKLLLCLCELVPCEEVVHAFYQKHHKLGI
jgi:chaperonin GroEL (HSP60 family)